MSIELREAKPSDAAAIGDLTRQAYAKWAPVIGREPKPMTIDYELAVQRHRFDLLLSNGQLVALIESVDEGEQFLIENLAVASDFQRRGFGRFLLAHAEQLASNLGKSLVRLYTNQRFVENIRLYQRVGYRN